MAKISNRFWFQLHGWFSLPIWLIFCFVCLTGTVSVISHELTWLTNSASRATNPDNLPEKSMPEIIAIVEKAHPSAKVSTAMSLCGMNGEGRYLHVFVVRKCTCMIR